MPLIGLDELIWPVFRRHVFWDGLIPMLIDWRIRFRAIAPIDSANWRRDTMRCCASGWPRRMEIGTDLVGMITHGPWTGYIYGGQSVVADSKGEILAVGADRDSDVIVVEVELK